MRIPLERQSSKAVYLQIRDRISRLIKSGALQPGDKLPSIRSLAQTTQVNKLTVIEAYSVLEADGLIHARQGAGYYVSGSKVACPQSCSHFAPPQNVIVLEQQGGSFFQSYMASIQSRHQPGTIDFSSGFPLDLGLEDLQRIARRAVKQVSDTLFQYDLPQGQIILRQQISRLLVQQGLEVTADDLIITNGSEQALAIAINYYVKPGDWVVVESPTYHGALSILAARGARVIGIPVTSEGMNLELLEQYLHTYRPKLIYTISTLHNPTGVTMPQSHRQQLLALAEQYECAIIEDNAYEGLSFEPVPPPIKTLDRRDVVTYVGTFSKTLMPGIRVGYIVATGRHYPPLLECKLLRDLHTSTVSQAIISEYLASGHYRRRLTHLRSTLLDNRNIMVSALEKYFPAQVSWTIPSGGLFLWVHLPEGLSFPDLCQNAIAQQVLITSGSAFFPGGQGYPALRLNFSHPPEKIEQGIAILGQLLTDALAVH
jgi:DNA-binding transcriptional MocR family regulator